MDWLRSSAEQFAVPALRHVDARPHLAGAAPELPSPSHPSKVLAPMARGQQLQVADIASDRCRRRGGSHQPRFRGRSRGFARALEELARHCSEVAGNRPAARSCRPIGQAASARPACSRVSRLALRAQSSGLPSVQTSQPRHRRRRRRKRDIFGPTRRRSLGPESARDDLAPTAKMRRRDIEARHPRWQSPPPPSGDLRVWPAGVFTVGRA